jgi:hypothetical protein
MQWGNRELFINSINRHKELAACDKMFENEIVAAAASEPEASEQGSRSKFCFVGPNQNFLFGALHDGTSEF